MPFDIRNHVAGITDRTSGNIHIACPACQEPNTKNPALSINLDTGAYHCFKCEGEKDGSIRQALGERKQRFIPSSTAFTTASVAKDVTVTLHEIQQNHQRLMLNSRLGKQWLLDRGFTLEAIAHYKLGIKRIKHLGKQYFGITIPIKADVGDRYYQKVRTQPWSTEDELPPDLPRWKQYKIPAQTWFTYFPPNARETYLCEGEWDAMLLGWMARQAGSPCAIATFTCGCETVPMPSELNKLPGKVTIFYDRNDRPNKKTGERPGEKGARKVAAALNDAAIAKVPQKPEHTYIYGWDVSDAINAGFTWDDFVYAASEATSIAAEVITLNTDSPGEIAPKRSRIVSNAALIERAADYIDWLVPELLSCNELFICAAAPRAGKSLLAMALAKAVATGGNFLDRVATQGNVLYVNLEDSEEKIKIRQQSQGWEPDLPVFWMDRFKLSEIDFLSQTVDDLDIKLIILDTLARIRDDGALETSAEISRALEPLQDLARDKRCAILLIHHTTKITTENVATASPFDMIRGSSAIRGVCRGSWILAKGERFHRLFVEHGFGETQDLEMRLDPDTLEWKSIRPWNPKSPTQPELILEYLETVGSATIPEIAEVLELKPNNVNTALWRLLKNGKVHKEKGVRKDHAIYHAVVKKAELLTLQETDVMSVVMSAEPLPDMDHSLSNERHNNNDNSDITTGSFSQHTGSFSQHAGSFSVEPLSDIDSSGCTTSENIDSQSQLFSETECDSSTPDPHKTDETSITAIDKNDPIVQHQTNGGVINNDPAGSEEVVMSEDQNPVNVTQQQDSSHNSDITSEDVQCQTGSFSDNGVIINDPAHQEKLIDGVILVHQNDPVVQPEVIQHQTVTTETQSSNENKSETVMPRKLQIGDRVNIDFPGSKRNGKSGTILRLKTIQNCEMADVMVDGEKRAWEAQISWLKYQPPEGDQLEML